MSTERERLEQEYREATDWTRHEFYEPLGLMVGDVVRVTLTEATRTMLERWLPDDAEAMWAFASVLGPRHAVTTPHLVMFLGAYGPSSGDESFPWGLVGEYNGRGKHEYDETDAPSPFGEDALMVFGYGFVSPKDVTHVLRVLGADNQAPAYEHLDEMEELPPH